MWPFRRRDERIVYLRQKMRECLPENRAMVSHAIHIAKHDLTLSAGECIRLAYWGASGAAEGIPVLQPTHGQLK